LKKFVAHLALLLLFVLISPAGLLAQQGAAAGAPLPGPGSAWKLPAHAVAGSTAERRAAWQKLTPGQRKEVLKRFAANLGPALAKAARQHTAASPPDRSVMSQRLGGAVQSTAPGAQLRISGPALFTPLTPVTRAVTPRTAISGPDNDFDGLPDDFENALGDAFTPVYHVSTGEQPGTGFALFGDFVPQTVIQNFPAVPPISHYRVTPVGFGTDSSGQQIGFLEIDYLTLWNRDDGLQIGGDCETYAAILGGLIGLSLADLLDGAQGHTLDDERSAALVGAPTSGFQYSTDPAAYSGYSYYTAAHEDTFFDHSAYLTPASPVPAFNHLNLGFSRAKHGTYTFNPDGLPLFPEWVIDTTYFTIDDLFAAGIIDEFDYDFYLFIADTLFFSCVVEHFGDQGGSFAGTRINVGEESQPINGSGFIRDGELAGKLNSLLWTVQ